MKKEQISISKSFLFFLSMAVIGLFVLSNTLYKSNQAYREKNRKLARQVDSLMSITAKIAATGR
jgi:hypothetical protein